MNVGRSVQIQIESERWLYYPFAYKSLLKDSFRENELKKICIRGDWSYPKSNNDQRSTLWLSALVGITPRCLSLSFFSSYQHLFRARKYIGASVHVLLKWTINTINVRDEGVCAHEKICSVALHVAEVVRQSYWKRRTCARMFGNQTARDSDALLFSQRPLTLTHVGLSSKQIIDGRSGQSSAAMTKVVQRFPMSWRPWS